MNTEYATDRLKLMVCAPQSAGLVTDFYNRNFEEFSRFEPLSDRARTVSYHKKNLDYEYNLFIRGSFVRFYIFEKNNPFTVIGTLSYREIRRDFYDSCIIGYKMDKTKRRLGYCKEAIQLGDKLMFTEFGLNRIEATVRPINKPSMRLLESIGYTNEGLLREKIKINGEFMDHYLYALLKRDILPI